MRGDYGIYLRCGRAASHRRVPGRRSVCGQRLRDEVHRRAWKSQPLNRSSTHWASAPSAITRFPATPTMWPISLATTATARMITSRPSARSSSSMAPGPGSGKMAVCLSQLYHHENTSAASRRAMPSSRRFPSGTCHWKHPVNLGLRGRYRRSERRVNMIDPFTWKAYGKIQSTTTATSKFFRSSTPCLN